MTGLWRTALLVSLMLFSARGASAQDRPPPPPPPKVSTDSGVELFMKEYYVSAIRALSNDLRRGLPPEEARETRAWLAEALRRDAFDSSSEWGMQDAVEEARAVVESSPACHARALLTLGDAYNPQVFTWDGASADSAFHYMQRAAACDPDDGNAWMSLWVEAIARADGPLAQEALERMWETEFWSPPTIALARWVLSDVPQDALLLAYGDGDTVPLEMLTRVEGFRPDVTVVNVSLAGYPPAARGYAALYGLPLPDSIETFESRYDARGSMRQYPTNVYWLSDHVIDYWLAESAAGRFRPVVAAPTMDRAVLANKTGVIYRGAYAEPDPASGVDPERVQTDVESFARSLAELRGDDFAGPAASAQDRSPVRHGAESYAYVPLYSLLWLAYEHATLDSPEASNTAFADAEAFARGAGLGGDPAIARYRENIDRLNASR